MFSDIAYHSSLTVTTKQTQLISTCRRNVWTITVCIVPRGSNNRQMWRTHGSGNLMTQTLTLNEFRGCNTQQLRVCQEIFAVWWATVLYLLFRYKFWGQKGNLSLREERLQFALILQSAILLKAKKRHVRRSLHSSLYHWENTNTFCRSRMKSPCALNIKTERCWSFFCELFAPNGWCSDQDMDVLGMLIFLRTRKICVKCFDNQVYQESSLNHELFCLSFFQKLRLTKWRKDE